MNVEIENDDLLRNLQMIKTIRTALLEIYHAHIFGISFHGYKINDTLEFHLSILEEILQKKELSPVIFQKILFISKCMEKMHVHDKWHYYYLPENKIDEVYEKIKNMYDFLNLKTYEELKKSSSQYGKVDALLLRFHIFYYHLINPKLDFLQYSREFSKIIPKDHPLMKFYEDLEKLILLQRKEWSISGMEFIEKSDIILELTEEIINDWNYLGIGGYQKMFQQVRNTYYTIFPEPRVSMILLKPPILGYIFKSNLLRKDENKKRFVIYYSPHTFDYFVAVPANNILSKSLFSGKKYKTVEERLKVYVEDFIIENKDKFEDSKMME